MSSSGISFAGDDWTKTKDARERKRIQDRLAQRAKRRRLRESDTSQDASGTNPDLAANDNEGEEPQDPIEGNILPAAHDEEQPEPDAESQVMSLLPRVESYQSSMNMDPDTFYLVLRCQTVIAALGANAETIPVHCKVFVPKVLNSTNIKQHTPSTLLPTPLQSEIPHLAFVAALPFPGLRDSILKVLGRIDYDDLWKDAVSGGFFVWGRLPWAAQGWEVTESFAKKWWFLMDKEVIETANFWRIQRGLRRLPPPRPQAEEQMEGS